MSTATTTCRTEGCTLPETADHATIHAARPGDLLTAYASLTHQLHSARQNLTQPERLTAYRSLRAQRDTVQAEILRRMGGAR